MEMMFVRGSEDYLADRIMTAAVPEGWRVERVQELTADSIGRLSDESLLFEGNILIWETPLLGAEEEAFSLLKENTDSDGRLIIRARSVRGNTKFLRWLTENAETVNCEPLSERDFMDFLNSENVRRGGILTRDQLRHFAERTRYGTPGIDLYMVDGWLSELELLARTGEPVTDADIDEAVQAGEAGTAFELIGLLSRGRYAELFDKAAAVKEDAIMVLGALLYSMRILSKLKVAKAQEIGITGFQAGNVKPLLTLSEGQINLMVDAVTEGTALAKNGVDDGEVMAQVLSKLCLIRSERDGLRVRSTNQDYSFLSKNWQL